jgi:GTP-binding protein
MGNIVAIVGRPNVGKSTFFNRLTESREAIVDPTPGVTRDRQYGEAEWGGKIFTVIDTGGYSESGEDSFEGEIRKQVVTAIQEATKVVFVVDVTTGITHEDAKIAEVLRKSGKPVLVLVNKVDNNQRLMEISTFYSLGLGELFPVSAINGSGTGEILDELISDMEIGEENTVLDLPRIAVVGRPNVGKSSFINTLLGVERNIVTSIAGTTRDSIYTRYNAYNFDFYLVDTAGLRKKTKVSENIEFYSVMRTIRAIEHCDVCLLMLDATQGLESQDLNVFHLAEKNGKGIVILVNKWDLIEEKDSNTIRDFEKQIREKTAPFKDVPIIFCSALTKQRVFKALETALETYQNRKRKIKTSDLNDKLLPIIDATPPPSLKGKYIKIKYITQLPAKVPSFAFFCNLPQYVKEPYKRFLENKIREIYDFSGVPVRIFMRKK